MRILRTHFGTCNFLENFIGHKKKKKTDEGVHGQQKCHSYEELIMSFLVPFNVVNFVCSLVSFPSLPVRRARYVYHIFNVNRRRNWCAVDIFFVTLFTCSYNSNFDCGDYESSLCCLSSNVFKKVKRAAQQ